MKVLALTFSLAAASTGAAAMTASHLIPKGFESRGADRQAIQTLLSTYTRASSAKDIPLFESLLLKNSIPFSAVPLGTNDVVQSYADIRDARMKSPPMMQIFRDIHIDQDGDLASARLVFVNITSQGSNWGFKTLQLVKTGGKWKIASDLFTWH